MCASMYVFKSVLPAGDCEMTRPSRIRLGMSVISNVLWMCIEAHIMCCSASHIWFSVVPTAEPDS